MHAYIHTYIRIYIHTNTQGQQDDDTVEEIAKTATTAWLVHSAGGLKKIETYVQVCMCMYVCMYVCIHKTAWLVHSAGNLKKIETYVQLCMCMYVCMYVCMLW